MDVFYVIVDTLAITLLVLITSNLVASAPRASIAWLVSLIAFNYVCLLLSARQDYASFIPVEMQLDFGSAYVVVNLARNSISAVFMLLSHALFRDDRHLPRIFIALIGLQLFLEEPLAWMLTSQWELANPEWKFVLYEVVPAFFQMTFSSFAVYWAVVELKVDLVEKRRMARMLLLIMLTVQGFLSLIIERIGFTGGFVSYFLMYPIHMTLVAVQVLTSAAVMFWLLRRDLLDFVVQAPSEPDEISSEDSANSREIERIVKALEQDQLYQQMGLTVSDLSRHVSIPEYRLRKLIHHHLGYRNFNSFLHHYRIEEVVRSLEDPSQNHTPILTLALTAGYQSINPFNRAFREMKGMTPTEFRRQVEPDHA